MTKPEKVAVIGAGGFLGTNLARFLASRVEDVRSYGRRRSFPEALHGLSWVSGELADAHLAETVAGCDVVIHLASTSTPATADRDIVADAQANVMGSLRLMEHCVAGRVGRLVFLSSGGTIYGIPPVIPTPESAPTDPITAYGVAKLAVEKYLEIFRRRHGLDYRILRVANIYGPYQTAEKGQGVVAAFLSRALAEQPLEIWGDGQVVRDYVFVSDVAEAIWAAMLDEGAHRVFNIGGGTGASVLQIAEAIERLVGRPLQRRFHPARPVDVPISVLDHSLATNELGWKPVVELEQGLTQTLDWMRQFRDGQAAC
jgi:UDP-glucose 4-epimerase